MSRSSARRWAGGSRTSGASSPAAIKCWICSRSCASNGMPIAPWLNLIRARTRVLLYRALVRHADTLPAHPHGADASMPGSRCHLRQTCRGCMQLARSRTRALHHQAVVILAHDHLVRREDFVRDRAGGVAAKVVQAVIDAPPIAAHAIRDSMLRWGRAASPLRGVRADWRAIVAGSLARTAAEVAAALGWHSPPCGAWPLAGRGRLRSPTPAPTVPRDDRLEHRRLR